MKKSEVIELVMKILDRTTNYEDDEDIDISGEYNIGEGRVEIYVG